jgi:hypothetical protein
MVNLDDIFKIILETKHRPSLECQTPIFDDEIEHLMFDQTFKEAFIIVSLKSNCNLPSIC